MIFLGCEILLFFFLRNKTMFVCIDLDLYLSVHCSNFLPRYVFFFHESGLCLGCNVCLVAGKEERERETVRGERGKRFRFLFF